MTKHEQKLNYNEQQMQQQRNKNATTMNKHQYMKKNVDFQS